MLTEAREGLVVGVNRWRGKLSNLFMQTEKHDLKHAINTIQVQIIITSLLENILGNAP